MDDFRARGLQAIQEYDPNSGTPLVLPSVSGVAIQSSIQHAISPETQCTVNIQCISNFLDFVGESIIPSGMSRLCIDRTLVALRCCKSDCRARGKEAAA